MDLLAAILLAIWLVGIVVNAASVAFFNKSGDGELHTRFQLAMEMNPVLVTGLLTVLIVAWPVTLAFSIATKRK